MKVRPPRWCGAPFLGIIRRSPQLTSTPPHPQGLAVASLDAIPLVGYSWFLVVPPERAYAADRSLPGSSASDSKRLLPRAIMLLLEVLFLLLAFAVVTESFIADREGVRYALTELFHVSPAGLGSCS
jgi:hypothetical protein